MLQEQVKVSERLVRKAETLERLGISESTYFRLIRARVLPAVVIGQSFRVRERDIQAAIEHGLPLEKTVAS
jgi:excisionase family DNA binding protein